MPSKPLAIQSGLLDFPVDRVIALFLTTWHMFFATTMTQIMAKFTTTLDSRHKVPMNPQTYM